MEIEKPAVLDILETNAPALSTTSDMPVVETTPDSSPPKEAAPEKAEPEKAEQLDESATSTTEKPGQQTEPPRGVGKALAELRQQKREAEARAKAAEDNLANALKLQERVKPPEEDQEPVRPSRDSFTDPDAYDTAILAYAEEKAAHTARKQVKEMLAEQQSAVQKQEQDRQQTEIRESYNARLEKARGKYADFEEVAQTPDVQVSMPMAHVIMTSDLGPDIQYFLGKNPEEAKRISAFALADGSPNVARQLYEMGLLAAQISQPASKPPVSTAPPPVRALKPASTVSAKSPDEESMEEYAARRKKELAARH